MARLRAQDRAGRPDIGGGPKLSRRALVKAAAAAGLVAPLGLLGGRRALGTEAQAASIDLKLAWNAAAVCHAPVALARDSGIFARHNLNVDLINYTGSTEQLLEAIATGHADAGIGMALRWLKPLEQGFDVRLVTGTHGGCMRLLAAPAAGVTDLAGLRGKTVAVSDLGSPAKHFFSILLHRQGIDPATEVEWRVYSADLLAVALDRGEVHALAHWDPLTWQFRRSHNLVELATNLTGEYHSRVCCVLGVRGSLLQDNPAAATALVRALHEAQDFAATRTQETAEAFRPYAPNASVEDLTAMLSDMTLHHHPVTTNLQEEIAAYVEDLKQIGVFRQTTDAAAFAQRVVADVAC